MQSSEHCIDVIKCEPASDSESDTQLISVKEEELTAFSAVKSEIEHHLDSVNLTVNENTGSNPVIGVPEDKLDDDKQHIDSFAFVAVKTEIKDEPCDDETVTQEFKDEITTEEHELLTQGSEEFIIHEDGSSTKNSEKVFKCETCGKVFLQHGRLISHLPTHNGEWPFKCNICGKGFSHSSKVIIHCRSHTGEKPFQCDICGKKYSEQGHLKTHHRRKHPSEKVSTCNVCGRRFSKNGSVIKHRRTQIDGHFFRCIVCGK